jgi:hypothetical protein
MDGRRRTWSTTVVSAVGIDRPAQLDEKNSSDASTYGSQIAVGRRKLPHDAEGQRNQQLEI